MLVENGRGCGLVETKSSCLDGERQIVTLMILQQRVSPGCLSLVLPCYNEESVLPLLRDELTKFIPTLGVPTEVILVDDGSSDQTLPFLLKWASENPAIKVVVLARNFGHQNAATAGLNAATGDAVVLMDADLQDPLEVIPQMIEKYREGYDVVYAQRITREGESVFKRFTAWLFYRLMKVFIHSNLPPDAGDFRLISRRCLDAVNSMHEIHRFLRGMIAWVGFMQVSVRYHRKQRAAGTTKYTLWKMLRFASNAIISFTPLPLRLSLLGGFVIALMGFGYGLYAAYSTLMYHDTVPGWTTQIIFTAVLGGAILMSNGILGEYIGRSFEELKGRPLYVVAHRVNFKE
jgi:glycosyltransferase involved in cell wall biosynthesis